MMNTLVLTTILTLVLSSLLATNASGEFPAQPDRSYDHGSITLVNNNSTYGYRLLRPEEQKTPAPLVIFLHGAGERGSNNKSQLNYLPKRFLDAPHLRNKRCYVLAMQCPQNEQWAPYRRLIGKQNAPLPAMEALMQAARRVMRDENIDPARIYLTGLSMGGYGSWDLAARHPEWFAAVVPICGGGKTRTAERLKDVPIWAFHGTADKVVPEQQSRQMIDAIRRAGGTPAYSPLPGVGHGSWQMAYGPGGAMEWMFAQKNPDPEAVQAISMPSNTN